MSTDLAPIFSLRHCQNGGDLCRAGQVSRVVCPDESCDIDDGLRCLDLPAEERIAEGGA